MNIYISFDMEGLAGIDYFSQEKERKERFQEVIHAQLHYVIEGIQNSSYNNQVEEITVADSHNNGNNLDYLKVSAMDDRVRLISGSPRKEFMMSGLPGHDVAIFLGYHAGAGQHKAAMDHSFSTTVHSLNVNSIKCSEAMVNALYAKELKIPVGLIIGDSGLHDQLIRDGYMRGIPFVITKNSLGRGASKYKNAQVLKREIAQAMEELLKKDPGTMAFPLLEAPYSITVEYQNTLQADTAERVPNTQRLDGYRIGILTHNAKEMINAISVLTTIVPGE